MDINPSEITKILKEQIKNLGEKTEVSEIGKVLIRWRWYSPEFMALIMFKLEKWLNLKMAQKEWH